MEFTIDKPQQSFEKVLELLGQGKIKELKLAQIYRPEGQGGLFHRFSGHTSGLLCLVQLSDGRLASGSRDGTIKLWDLKTGECKNTLSGHTNDVYCLVQLSDGRLASSSSDTTIKLWDVKTGECKNTLSGHTSWVRCLVQLSDGRLASSSDDNTIKLWDVKTGECKNTLSGHTHFVYCLVQLSDGRLASSSYDKTIKLWDLKTGNCEKTLSGHTSSVYCLVQLRDGRLASGLYDNTIKLWDLKTGECKQTLSGHASGILHMVQLSDGRLASGSSDNTIKLWDLKTGNCEKTLSGHTGAVFSLVQLSDGRLASGSHDKTILLADLKDRPLNDWEWMYLLQALEKSPKPLLIDGAGVPWSLPLLQQLQKVAGQAQLENKHLKIKNLPLLLANGQLVPWELIEEDKRLGVFVTDGRIAQFRDPEGGTILHALVKRYGQSQQPKILKNLLLDCIPKIDFFARDKNGHTAYWLAQQLKDQSLAKILKLNRPAFDLAQVMLDWCEQDKDWEDVTEINGQKVERRLVEEQLLTKQKTPPKTQILKVQALSTEKRQLSQTDTTTTDTQRVLTVKMDQVLTASNRQLQSKTKSQEHAQSHTQSKSQFEQQSNSQSSSQYQVKSSQWSETSSTQASGGFSLFGFGASVGRSSSSGRGGSEESGSSTNQQRQNVKGESQLNSQSSMSTQSQQERKEEEQQQQFSFAKGDEQQQTFRFSQELKSEVNFETGFHFIVSEQETTWTEDKTFSLRFSISGQVGIGRKSNKELLQIPVGKILKKRQSFLMQNYGDYRWDFSNKESILCSLGGKVKEHHSVVEKSSQEHPLYRIKRLIEEFVHVENFNRKELDEFAPAWEVNIQVESSKVNPYEGTIEVRCNQDTHTGFLKQALRQFCGYSEDEQFSEVSLKNGVKLFILKFSESKDLLLEKPLEIISNNIEITSNNNNNQEEGDKNSKPSAKPSAGLVRVNSAEFNVSFFNQVKQNKQKKEYQMSACQRLCHLVNNACSIFDQSLESVSSVLMASQETCLQLRFKLKLSMEDKIRVSSIRLALAKLLEYAPEHLLKPTMLGINEWGKFDLDLNQISFEKIQFICDQQNEPVLIEMFMENYQDCYQKLKLAASENKNLVETRDQLYENIKQEIKQLETQQLAGLDF